MKRSWLSLSIVLAVAATSLIVAALYLLRGAPIADTALASANIAAPQTGVEITYIANEGVLLASGDKQVLIDGLHRISIIFKFHFQQIKRSLSACVCESHNQHDIVKNSVQIIFRH